jgi:hypothetical protein
LRHLLIAFGSGLIWGSTQPSAHGRPMTEQISLPWKVGLGAAWTASNFTGVSKNGAWLNGFPPWTICCYTT